VPIDARVIIAYLDGDGNVAEISDPNRTLSWLNDPDSSLPLSGKHYGWELEPLIRRGIPRALTLPTALPAASGSRAHGQGNSAQAVPTSLIKLDCGYWGAYDRAAEGTDNELRYFGVIEGHDVWLCQFRGRAPYVNGDDAPGGDTLLGQLLNQLSRSQMGIRLVAHAVAPVAAYTRGLPEERLTVIVPDLHLPEKWAEMPAPSVFRGLPQEAIRTLYMRLYNSQHEPSSGADVAATDASAQADIQSHLEALERGSPTYPLRYVSGSHFEPNLDDAMPVEVPDYTTVDITKEQFLAAKAVVDRSIILRTCWFYAAGGTRAHPGSGDASPAVDLVNFLNALKEFKDSGKNVKVYQLGDLYELWLGREFLYRGYTVDVQDAVSNLGGIGLRAMSGMYEDFQYRMDKDWTDSSGGTHPIKRYAYHLWPRAELFHRHRIGPDGAPGSQLPRLRRLLEERVASVKEFSLPMPTHHPGTAHLPSAMTGSAYQHTNPQGVREYKWNKMILDLFSQLGFENIYGNHDGYRGDPSLNGGLSGPDKAKAWISEPGLWLEHSHRWDDYNRDGMAYGAGVTNLVYYFFRVTTHDPSDGLHHDDALQAYILPSQEHTAFVPGAAQWFLMRNFGGFSEIGSGDNAGSNATVHPFGIYVGGHTHAPDLVEIRFQPQLRVRAARAVRETVDEIGSAVSSGASRARRAASSFVESVGSWLSR